MINFEVLRVLTKQQHHILNDCYKKLNLTSISWQLLKL